LYLLLTNASAWSFVLSVQSILLLTEILTNVEVCLLTFELRHILTIPRVDIEARHDYMLSVTKDRVDFTAHEDISQPLVFYDYFIKLMNKSSRPLLT
jgi:hypothetical protein